MSKRDLWPQNSEAQKGLPSPLAGAGKIWSRLSACEVACSFGVSGSWVQLLQQIPLCLSCTRGIWGMQAQTKVRHGGRHCADMTGTSFSSGWVKQKLARVRQRSDSATTIPPSDPNARSSWEFSKARGPNTDPNYQGSYHNRDLHKNDPPNLWKQPIEASVRLLWT